MKPLAVMLLFAMAAMPAASQTPAQKPSFEAASIKPSKAAPGSPSGIRSVPGRVIGSNVTLKRCIRGAYDVPETLIFGAPKWVDDERYDIEANTAGPASDAELMIMLQSLLAERFHLVFHREQRQMSGYALVVTKGGLKAERSAEGTKATTNANFSAGSIDAQASTITNLAQKLSDALHVSVADSTKVEGAFNFKLSWNPKDVTAPASKSVVESSAPSIFTALEEQLGLKLESSKRPVEALVIDSVQRPSEN
jgi:uncharacterized protein (TIGR03435 family)